MMKRLAWLLVALAGACDAPDDQRVGLSEPILTLGVMTDDAFVPIADHDRVPAVFGSQGALMVVGALELTGASGGGSLPIEWATERRDQDSRPHSGVIRRKATEIAGSGGDGWRVETLYWLVEWVALDFDASIEREVAITVAVDVDGRRIDSHATVLLDIQGTPFPSHSGPPPGGR